MPQLVGTSVTAAQRADMKVWFVPFPKTQWGVAGQTIAEFMPDPNNRCDVAWKTWYGLMNGIRSTLAYHGMDTTVRAIDSVIKGGGLTVQYFEGKQQLPSFLASYGYAGASWIASCAAFGPSSAWIPGSVNEIVVGANGWDVASGPRTQSEYEQALVDLGKKTTASAPSCPAPYSFHTPSWYLFTLGLLNKGVSVHDNVYALDHAIGLGNNQSVSVVATFDVLKWRWPMCPPGLQPDFSPDKTCFRCVRATTVTSETTEVAGPSINAGRGGMAGVGCVCADSCGRPWQWNGMGWIPLR